MQELIEKIKREQVSFKEESTIIDGNKEYVKGVLKWLETALVFISQLKQKAKQKTLLKQSSSRVVVKQVIKKVVKEVPIHYVLKRRILYCRLFEDGFILYKKRVSSMTYSTKEST